MNCKSCVDLLQEYLDGGPKPASMELIHHLNECGQCRGRWHAAERFRKLDWRSPQRPPLHAERIVTAVQRDRGRQHIQWWAGAAASIAAALVVAIWLGSSARPVHDGSLAKSQSSEVGGLRIDVMQTRMAVAGYARQSVDGILPKTKLSEWSMSVVPSDAIGPAARSLNDARQGLSAGMEPVTGSAQRAYEMFVPKSLRGETANKPMGDMGG